MIRIGPTEESILREITNSIEARLMHVGLFFRIFSRIKVAKSIEHKLDSKKEEYIAKQKKMQDVFGIRITVYFLDDEAIAEQIVRNMFEEIPDAHSIDQIVDDRFGPSRHNLVFKINKDLCESSSLFDHEFIDASFEVQFRTVFSEGWHEVEHDLRYKCQKDWEGESQLSRQLNGQLASLENCDWSILKIFDELAYKKYKSREWASFFRNVLRIRYSDGNFSEVLLNWLNDNVTIVKECLRGTRVNIISSLPKLTTTVPLTMDFILFVTNRVVFKDEKLKTLESDVVKKILDESFKDKKN